jgi:GNAT superfamily N-acetyltransferase
MERQVRIRHPRPDELETLRDIERAAGRSFAEIGMLDIAEDAPDTVEVLGGYLRDGRAWVATDPNGEAVAYILVDVVDGNAHVEQVSVRPDRGGQRIGLALVDHVGAWAKRRGLFALTLTTFRDVAWNAPYYARCGFEVIPRNRLTPGLARIRADEAARGLDRYPRVAMRRGV